ncbi:MAG: phosphatidylglycerophosphatase A [Candidatus Tectomicrobia bacterium]|uniref:Phosphatidylglycerophosphatase A n=1 Tax=Tectimicrobiota bacterium TaxID=2528274 RepID=A0A932M219_UNCTE|nr:phosphatidylglycerophosphatase A [Candidatus Tectomicrobia bacterium]
MEKLILWLATAGGVGRSPVAPGTLGAAVAVPLALLLSRLGTLPFGIVGVGVIVLGVEISRRAEILLECKDAPAIVIDEVAGMLLSLFLVPLSVFSVAAGFILFRIFDIWKPVPSLEKLPGGFGVMADDVLAGLITNGILHGVNRLPGGLAGWI